MNTAKKIYLDYAATTPVDERVLRAMEPYFSLKFGNPGSLHSFGQEAIAAVDLSRETIAKAIGADFREVVFTGSATEANNLALRGTVRFYQHQSVYPEQSRGAKISINQRPRLIISAIEHESVLETARDLEQEGIDVVYLPVDREGVVDLDKLKSALNERTVLVSIMYANNEIGTIQPISAVAEIVREFRKQNLEFNGKSNPKSYILNPKFYPLFHVDAVQAFQYLDCDVGKLGVDLMTFSAHKMYGPKGTGALYAKNLEFRSENLGRRNGTPLNPKSYILNPLIVGGGQEFGVRSGTENVPNIVGFAKAAELVTSDKKQETRRVSELCNYFWKELKNIYPRTQLNSCSMSHVSCRSLPNILNVYFPDHLAEDLLIKLDMVGVAVSSGSACSVRSTKLSHVLEAIGLSPERVKRSIRFSFGRPTIKGEIAEALRRIKKIIS